MEDYSKYKVLVATPNYTNLFPSEVYGSHMSCVQEWTKLGIDFKWMVIGRTFVNFARTQACEYAIDGGYTHILWLDDDAVVSHKILPQFLKHDKDVVISPYPMRRPPHEIGILSSLTGDYRDVEQYGNWQIKDMLQGLKECDGGGTHCMLMKVACLTEVFGESVLEGEGVGDEESMKTESDLGYPFVVMPKVGTEDMYMCYRLKLKGVKIWCDTDVFASHVGFSPVIGPDQVHQGELSKQQPENVDEQEEPGDSIPMQRMREGAGHDYREAEDFVSGVRGKQVENSGVTALV